MQAGTGGRAPFTLGGNAAPTTGGTATQGGKLTADVVGGMSTLMGGRSMVVDGPGDSPTVRFPVTPTNMRLKMSPPRSSRAVAPELHNTSTTTHNAAAAAADWCVIFMLTNTKLFSCSCTMWAATWQTEVEGHRSVLLLQGSWSVASGKQAIIWRGSSVDWWVRNDSPPG